MRARIHGLLPALTQELQGDVLQLGQLKLEGGVFEQQCFQQREVRR